MEKTEKGVRTHVRVEGRGSHLVWQVYCKGQGAGEGPHGRGVAARGLADNRFVNFCLVPDEAWKEYQYNEGAQGGKPILEEAGERRVSAPGQDGADDGGGARVGRPNEKEPPPFGDGPL